MNNILKECEDILKKAKCDLGNASSEIELNNIKAAYVGKKGTINAFLKQIPSLPPNERPKFGKKINMVKKEFSTLLKEQLQSIKSKKTTKNNIDISLPGRKQKIGRKHPVSAVIDEIVSIFRRLGFIVADGPDIEDEYHNFDALNTPADHPSRDLQDTFYLPNGKLLRTQTSPVQIRVMENTKPPIRIIAPGRCYRHDTPDSTHSMNFHQIEGLYVDKNVSLADLKAVLLTFAHEIFGKDVKIRFRPHFFPFTEPSIEYDFSCVMCNGKGCRICKQSGWLEISGAGMVDPAVFEKVGYDPNIYSGYAFGMGIERIAMLLYAISDIRLLYENDIRFLKQF